MSAGPSSSTDRFPPEEIFGASGSDFLNSMSDSRGSTTLLEKYELLGGVPTRMLLPSTHGSCFTCHAFSKDKRRLAAGDTAGTVRSCRPLETFHADKELLCRLWRTSSYDLVGVGHLENGVAISTLSFLHGSSNTVIVVDRRGSVWLFIFRDADGGKRIPATINTDVIQVLKTGFEAPEGSYADLLRNQLSSDGQTLALFHTVWNNDIEKHNFIAATFYKFDAAASRMKTLNIQSVFEESPFNVPVLSKNGSSLLVCCFFEDENTSNETRAELRQETHIRVIPELDFDAEDQRYVELEGQRASWGLDGDWLLVWDCFKKRPRLSIYSTVDIAHCGRNAQPAARKTLDLGLLSWKAMITGFNPSMEPLTVLIYEVVECGRKRLGRFYLWNTEKDYVLDEVHMNMCQYKEADQRRAYSFARPVEQAVECRMPPTTCDAYYLCVLRDVFPDFCISRNKNWIGALSGQRHAAGISSMMTGVTTWKFRLGEDFKLCPFRAAYCVSFDPVERHFVIFGNNGIVACKPNFLHSSASTTFQGKSFRHSWDADVEDDRSSEAWHVLPSTALAKAKMTRMRVRKSPWHALRQHNHHVRSLIDASQSADGSLLAMIALLSQEKGTSAVYVAKESNEPPAKPFAGLRFPMLIRGIEAKFEPVRIVIYETKSIALFSIGVMPAAIFCDIESRKWEIVYLEIDKCLDVSLTEDRSRVAILDMCSVRIFDLGTRQTVNVVAYQVDFSELLKAVQESSRWRRRESEGLPRGFNSERRIADDGESVLLAWDVKNRKSLVVNPSTVQSKCEAWIRRADGSLSDFCVLSASGTSTSFVDVNDLANGKITIAVYNEKVQKAVFHFHVAERIPVDLSPADVLELLSSVFYGVSQEGNELFTITIGVNPLLPHQCQIKDKISVFNMYGADDCIPTYDQITLKKFSSIQRTFKRLYDEHGVSAFSAPSSDGMSIFQKAFLEGNKEMVETIKKFAIEYESLLAVEWTSSSSGATCNLLQKALKSMSSTRIKEAIEIVNSEVVPFRNAAKIMKQSFKELVANDLAVVEYALAKNLLVTHACDLDVHAKFMDPKRRRDTADHIDTSDTLLDWNHIKDEEALKKNWQKKNEGIVKDMESHGNDSVARGSLKFVRIEDAAKTGMGGIIRPLLLKKVPERFFEFDVVQWIVMFKWLKIWRKRFLRSAAWYAAFLAFFTAYAIYLSRTSLISDRGRVSKAWLSSLLAVAFVFSGHAALEEGRQLRTYLRDGIKHVDLHQRRIGVRMTQLNGFFYYLSFKWNWLDLVSCFLMMAVVTPLHILSFYFTQTENALSAFVAIECIILYAKVWYYAQPFRVSGPLVQMIGNIVWDCWAFLALAFVIMLGYAVALPVLFRQVSVSGNSCAMVPQEANPLVQMNCSHVAVPSLTNDSNLRTVNRQRCSIDVQNGCFSGKTYCESISITANVTGGTFDSLEVSGKDCLVSGSREDVQDRFTCDDIKDLSETEDDEDNTIAGGKCTANEGNEGLLGIKSCEHITVSTNCTGCDLEHIQISAQGCESSWYYSGFLNKIVGRRSSEPENLDFHRHLHRSLLTLFYAVVGNFEHSVYLSTGDLSWLTTAIFVSYLLAQLIVLLNLLISLMGDTFDRVKRTEKAQLLMGRAQFIDACEAALTESQCDKIDAEIGKFLHVLVNVVDDADRDSTVGTGKFTEIERTCREVIRSSETNIVARIKDVEQHVSKMNDRMQELQQQLSGQSKKKEGVQDFTTEQEHSEPSVAASYDLLSALAERVEEVLDYVKAKHGE